MSKQLGVSIRFYFFAFFSILFVNVYALDFTLYGHNSGVWEIETDGGVLYSAGADGTMKIWSEELVLLSTTTTHNSWARCIAINDKYVAVGGYKPDNVIKIYDKSTLKLLHTLSAHKGSVFTMLFYKSFLISAGSDNTIIIWKDFKVFKILKIHDGWIRKLIVFQNYLVSGDENGRVIFSLIDDFQVKKVFEMKSQILSANVFQGSLYIGLSNGDVYRFDIDKNGTFKHEKSLSFPSSVQSMANDGKMLYIATEGKVSVLSPSLNSIRNFELSASEITSIKVWKGFVFAANREGDILKYSVDGRYVGKAPRHFQSSSKIYASKDNLLVGREDGRVESYNIKTGLIEWVYQAESAIRFVVDFKDNAIVGTSTGKLLIIKNGVVQSTFYNNDALISFSVSTDGNTLYIGSFGKLFSLSFSGKRWELKKIFDTANEWITAVYDSENHIYVGTNTGKVYRFDKSKSSLSLFATYKSTVVKISNLENSIVVLYFNGIYSLYDGKSCKNYSAEVFPLYCALVDNKGLVFGGEKLRIYDRIMEFEAPVIDISFHKNRTDTIFVSLSNGLLLQIENYRVVRRFSSTLSNISTIYADEIVVCGHEDGNISIWNHKDGKFHLTMLLNDHTDSIREITRYNNYIISSSSDRTVRIWDLKSGKLSYILTGHKGYVWSIYVINDILISGDWDGKLFVWDLTGYNKRNSYTLNLSVTDIWASSVNNIYVSTLEGYIVRITSGKIYKRKLSSQTLWSLDGKVQKDGTVELFTAGWDGKVYVLDGTLNLKREFKAHNSTIFKVICYKNTLLTVGTDNLIKVWSEKFEIIDSYSDFRQAVLSVALSKSLGKIVTTDGKGVYFIDISQINKE